MDYFNVMDLSNDLFARKVSLGFVTIYHLKKHTRWPLPPCYTEQFPDMKDSSIKNALDRKRKKEDETIRALLYSGSIPNVISSVDLSMEGHGVLFVVKESLDTRMPLCMGLGSKSNKVNGNSTGSMVKFNRLNQVVSHVGRNAVCFRYM